MQKKAQAKQKLKPRHILLVSMIVLIGIACLAIPQQQKLAQINTEKQILEQKLAQLELEEQLLMRMIEYAHTDEYIEQIAREKLGYVWPDDIKFYREEQE
jgi:cell division protein FtsB